MSPILYPTPFLFHMSMNILLIPLFFLCVTFSYAYKCCCALNNIGIFHFSAGFDRSSVLQIAESLVTGT